MRAVSLFLALISLFLPSSYAGLCPSVECSATLPSTMCYRFSEDSYKIQLKACGTNEVCEVNQMASSYDYDLTSSGLYCKGSSYIPEGKFPGETCKVKQECRSGVCGSGICQGMPVGAACKDTWECESGVTCQQGICEFQKKEGVECLEDQDCANNLLCHAGICTAYFSLRTGESGTENPYLCKSGYIDDQGVCQNAPANVNSPDSTCSKDSECPLTNGQDGTCLCGLTTEEAAFCAAQPGDEEFADYQNLLKQVLDTSIDCHYNISLSRRCSKQTSNPVFSSYLNAFYIYRYRPLIISIPDCVSSVMPFALDYSYSGASLGSSSGTNMTMLIVIVVCVVVGLISAGLLCFFCGRRIMMREAREQRVHNAIVTGEYGAVEIKEGVVSKQVGGDWRSQFSPEDLVVTVRDLIYLKKGIPVARAVSQDTNDPVDGLEAELPVASPKSRKEDTLIETASDTKRSTALFVKRSA